MVWCGYEGYGVVVDMVDMVGMVGMVTPIHRTELIERFFGGGVHYYSHLFFCCCFPLFLEKNFFFLGFGGKVRRKAKQYVRLCVCACIFCWIFLKINLGSWIS